jgi:hypothetical protein
VDAKPLELGSYIQGKLKLTRRRGVYWCGHRLWAGRDQVHARSSNWENFNTSSVFSRWRHRPILLLAWSNLAPDSHGPKAQDLSSPQSASQELLFHVYSLAGPISNDHWSGSHCLLNAFKWKAFKEQHSPCVITCSAVDRRCPSAWLAGVVYTPPSAAAG